MRIPNPSVASGYALAVAATLLALLVRIVAGPLVQASSPFLMFTPAVMLSAWYGGLGPGLVSTIAGALLGNYFLLVPRHSFSMAPSDLARMMVFILVGLQISWLSGQLRAAKRRAEEDAQSARRSERLYRTLASNFPDGFVALFDVSLHWTLVGGAGMEAAGFALGDLQGKPIGQTLPQATAVQVEPLCRAVLEGHSMSADVSHGERVYAAHFLPLRDQEGGAHAGMAIFEDITERVRARNELQWAHDTLERRVAERTSELHFQKTLLESQSQASLDGILAVSQTGQVIFANRRFRDLWNIPGGALQLPLLRRHLRAHLIEQQDPLATERASEARTHPAGADEMLLADGRTIERYSAPIADPSGTCYGRVWFFRDTTERKRLQREIINASERERQRIGQDLHDDLCQQLTGIACMGRLLQKQLEEPPRRDREASAASRIVQMVQHANQKARDLAKGLQPVQLQTLGLPAALQELCASAAAMFQVTCQFRGDDRAAADLGDVTAVHLYRIAQEAITNSVRHGKAGRVLVDLVRAVDRLILTIEDDGVGFPDVLPREGLGLHTMSYRARMAGGSVSVEPGQPAGTIVTCSVPLPRPQRPAARRAQGPPGDPQLGVEYGRTR